MEHRRQFYVPALNQAGSSPHKPTANPLLSKHDSVASDSLRRDDGPQTRHSVCSLSVRDVLTQGLVKAVRCVVASFLFLVVCAFPGTENYSSEAAASTIFADAVRDWTDAGGTRHARAALLHIDGEKVWLRRPDGRATSTMLSQLSPSDRQYIASYAANRAVNQQSNSRPTVFDPAIVQSLLDDLPSLNKLAIWFQVLHAGDRHRLVPAALIYMRVSREFLDDDVQRTVRQWRPVEDSILGTRIYGESNTIGETHLVLRPSRDSLLGDIRFIGTVHSRTVGYNGPAILHYISDATFRAEKAINMGDSGLSAAPAIASVSTRLQTTNIQTTLPRLRGRIATRIAWNRAEKSRSEAETISSNHTAAIIRDDLDKQVDQSVATIQETFRAKLAEFELDRDHLAAHMNFRTTPEYVEMAMIRQDANAEEKSLRPPPVEGNPDVAIRVNRILLSRVFANPQIGPKIASVLSKLLIAQGAEKAIVVSYASEELPQNQEKWSVGRDWLTLEYTDPRRQPSSAKTFYR